jgi:hypothetical protein
MVTTAKVIPLFLRLPFPDPPEGGQQACEVPSLVLDPNQF